MKRFFQSVFQIVFIVPFCLSLWACNKDKDKLVKQLHVLPGQTSSELFALGEQRAAKKRYEEAIEYFDAVKNNFPYSKEALEAELRAADCYFGWKQYLQAAAGYETFHKLHPSHEKAPYAMIRQAESYFSEAPKTIDRDLTYCVQTIEVVRRFFRYYPESEYGNKGRNISFQCQQRIAGREFYVGRFYYRQDKYSSSVSRLEGVLKDHSGFGYDEKAAWYLGLAYMKLKEKEKARVVFEKLAERYPQGHYGKKAAGKIKRLKG